MIRSLLCVPVWLFAASAVAAPLPVTAVAFHPNGTLLAAGTRDVVALLDPNTGDVTAELPGQTGRVTGLSFAKNGTLAVASGEPGKSGVLRLYPAGAEKPSAEWAAHKDAVYTIAFSPDGATLATAGYDRVVKLWDVPPKVEPRLTLTDHSDAVYSLAFSPDGKLLASGAADRAVKVWDPATGKRLYTLGDPTDWVYAVAWAPTGNRLAAAGADKSVRVWEATAAGGKLLGSAFAHEKPVLKLLWSNDGKTLFSFGEDRVGKAWDPAKLVETRVFTPQPDSILSAALRPDGKQLAVGRFDGSLVLLDPATGKPTATPLPAKPKPPAVSKVTPDAVSRGTTVRIAVEGTHLGTVTAVKANNPGVSAKLVPGGTAKRLELDVTAAETASVGAVSLTLTSAAGDSAPVRVWVDRFPVAGEAGSTDAARSGMTIAPPVTVVGRIDRAGDADFYRFKAIAGQEIGVQLVTAGDTAKFDPVLTLTDETGVELAEGVGGRLGFVVPKAGVYAIGVRDQQYRGGPDAAYRLHVGPVPVVTGLFPLAVQRGVSTTVHVAGVNLGKPGGLAVTVAPPADAAIGSKFTVAIPRANGDPVGAADVTVSDFPAVVVAPDSGAMLRTVPMSADGVLAKPGDAQSVRFPAKKGERLVVEVEAARLGSPVDSFVEVLDSAGKPVPLATLRCVAKVTTNLRDRTSSDPGIRLESWNELAMRDYLYGDGELMRVHELPKNPDDDCRFVAVDGKRVGFFGTTPKQHAYGTTLYKVDVHPPGSSFPPNGMPAFELVHRNDDGGPGLGKDSRVFFTAPADGVYTARVSDATGAGSSRHAYRLTVRPPKPDFRVRVSPVSPAVAAGGAVPLTATADRLDGYDGPIDVRFEAAAPFRAPATTIEAEQTSTVVALTAGSDPLPKTVPPLKVVARATIDGKEVVHETTAGTPKRAPNPDLVTTTAAGELVIRPGREAKFVVKIERRNGFAGRVPLEVRGLPYGVRVLNIGLNGILVLPQDSEREIVVFAEPWVVPTTRPFVVSAKREGTNAEFAAPAVMLRVEP